jgi:hypothetical protein
LADPRNFRHVIFFTFPLITHVASDSDLGRAEPPEVFGESLIQQWQHLQSSMKKSADSKLSSAAVASPVWDTRIHRLVDLWLTHLTRSKELTISEEWANAARLIPVNLSHFRLVTIRAYVPEHDEARDHRR